MDYPMMSNLEFISWGYFLPALICIIGIRIGIARKEIDKHDINVFVTFCPIINMIIATLFVFVTIFIIAEYIVNGSYEKE